MCHCVQSVRNLLRGRGKFNVYEEIISLQFTVHDTSHHICKQCLRKLQRRRGVRTNLRELDEEIFQSYNSKAYCWFSHDATKIQTKKTIDTTEILLHDALKQLKTNFHTNFRSKRVLGFVIEYA